jgi:predicted site-specific integrase-resolvase
MKRIKLSEYAKINGIGYRAAWNRFNSGKIENAHKNNCGTIFVDLHENKVIKNEYNVIYSRVSTNEQKKDLETQIERTLNFANAKGLTVHKIYKEIASGLNDKRQKLQEILEDENITNIIIENKDRLTRFGFNYIETLLKLKGVNIIVVNEVTNDKEDLIQDFISVITSFCARIYSKRRTKNNVEKILNELK